MKSIRPAARATGQPPRCRSVDPDRVDLRVRTRRRIRQPLPASRPSVGGNGRRESVPATSIYTHDHEVLCVGDEGKRPSVWRELHPSPVGETAQDGPRTTPVSADSAQLKRQRQTVGFSVWTVVTTRSSARPVCAAAPETVAAIPAPSSHATAIDFASPTEPLPPIETDNHASRINPPMSLTTPPTLRGSRALPRSSMSPFVVQPACIRKSGLTRPGPESGWRRWGDSVSRFRQSATPCEARARSVVDARVVGQGTAKGTARRTVAWPGLTGALSKAVTV